SARPRRPSQRSIDLLDRGHGRRVLAGFDPAQCFNANSSQPGELALREPRVDSVADNTARKGGTCVSHGVKPPARTCLARRDHLSPPCSADQRTVTSGKPGRRQSSRFVHRSEACWAFPASETWALTFSVINVSPAHAASAMRLARSTGFPWALLSIISKGP